MPIKTGFDREQGTFSCLENFISEENNNNCQNNYQLYRKRQEINEHIFGTIKRQWNLYYTNLRGLEKVNGELALIMTVYNIKRAKNILGLNKLMRLLQNWTPKYPGGTLFAKIWLKIKRYKNLNYLPVNNAA